MRFRLWCERWGLIVVMTAAVVVRGAVLATSRDLDMGTAAAFKHGDTARNFIEGRGFIWDGAYLRTLLEASRTGNPRRPKLELFEEVPAPPPGGDEVRPFRGRPPGYSVVLAATWKIFGQKLFVYSQALFCALDVLSCFLVWWLAAQLFGPVVAFGAGILYATSLPHAMLSIFPGHDAVSSLPIMAGLCLFWLALREDRWWYFPLAGLALGLGTLVRQEPYFVPIVCAVALVMTRRYRQALAALVLMQAVIVAVNVPWTQRNQRLFGKSLALSPAYAANILVGIGGYPNRWGVEGSDEWVIDFVRQKAGPVQVHSPEFNRACMDEVKRIVGEDPVWFAKTVVHRATRFLVPTIVPFEMSYSFYVKYGGQGGMAAFLRRYPIQGLTPILYKAGWLLFWAAGLFYLFRLRRHPDRRRVAVTLTLIGVPLYYLLSHAPMHCESRFILPGYTPLIILGVAGLASLWRDKDLNQLL